LTANENTGSLLKHITVQLNECKQQFQAKLQELETTCSRTVVNELPYTNWLHDYLSSKLESSGFIVDTQSKIIKPMGPVNEYAYSLPDVLIFHGKDHTKTTKALLLKVCYPYVDVLCENELHMEGEEVEVLAMAGEVKVECVRDDAVNECFFNMFSQGVNLAMRVLSSGKIVKRIKMYGITVAVHQPERAKLLQLIMDFQTHTCQFKLVADSYNFTHLIEHCFNYVVIINITHANTTLAHSFDRWHSILRGILKTATVLDIHTIQTFSMYTCLYTTLHTHAYTYCVVLSYS